MTTSRLGAIFDGGSSVRFIPAREFCLDDRPQQPDIALAPDSNQAV
jgi:hypothetical protein